MSSRPAHYRAGVVSGLAMAWWLYPRFNLLQCFGVFLGALIGSSAPDWLEISRWWSGKRHSVIPHRTITHWMLGWFVLTAWVGMHGFSHRQFEWFLGFGFCISATLHVLMDALTPMGVPIAHPWRRTRLR